MLYLTLVSSLLSYTTVCSALTGRFMQVTDFHLDPHYAAGTDPATWCHRKNPDQQELNTAGPFGTLSSKCDAPPALVEASFAFMKKQLQDIDFILYTGDSARHNRDKDALPRTEQEGIEAQRRIVQYFEQTYNLKSIPCIPAIGNNDVFDNNEVVLKDPQFQTIENIWTPFGLNLTDSFREGGYFMQALSDRVRVISMNTMLLLRKNKKLSDCDDPSQAGAIHLQWLEQVLEDTRKQNSKAYVIAHVPPNGKTDKMFYKPVCYDKYLALLASYGDVILGHFAGHFNNDQLTVITKDHKHLPALPTGRPQLEQKVATVLFNAPSIIPLNNPAIRIYEYEIQGDKYPVGTIRDWYQYYADLEKANESGQLDFQLEYQASKLYGVDRFDAEGASTVFQELSNNNNVFDQYRTFVTVSKPHEESGEDDDD
ncbi:Acid sphingomyelinase-like phosphodiesterase 3b [Apophysomyces ossiformis]|uniref:Acid sphingomyelinase-like phosphodiesterase 3b n=1 Tax=Apophysomyces ossiformis TaxID=679940 RepID=A0A8H7EPM6_9FUNG|nr:Acid sphingomyelinase-like phosphodiesterase 3b [Apophysomyces ossiformis]